MRCLIIASTLVFAGCDSEKRIPVDSPEIETSGKRIETEDPEIEIVRAWIAENSDSGTWDEVRWYSPRSYGEARLFRMKYRTRSSDGGKILFDRIFWLEDEKLDVLNKAEHDLYTRLWE